MIKCDKCGYDEIYLGTVCPKCNNKVEITPELSDELLTAAKEAVKNREFETAVENYRILADAGVTEGEREFARMLEVGELIDRSLDGAMHYYYKAAKKNDA